MTLNATQIRHDVLKSSSLFCPPSADFVAVVLLRVSGGVRPPIHQPFRQQTSRPLLHRLRHALVLLRARSFYFSR